MTLFVKGFEFTSICFTLCSLFVGRILLFVLDAHFHVGMSTLIVKTGKISLFAWDAYFHSGMPIFTVKLGIRMPIFT